MPNTLDEKAQISRLTAVSLKIGQHIGSSIDEAGKITVKRRERLAMTQNLVDAALLVLGQTDEEFDASMPDLVDDADVFVPEAEDFAAENHPDPDEE